MYFCFFDCFFSAFLCCFLPGFFALFSRGGVSGDHLKVAVFRVADLSEPKRRFKVDVNAQQRYLTGGVVMCT